jgi:hypothetical protein
VVIDNEHIIRNVYDIGTDTLYRYDPETGDTNIPIKDLGEELVLFVYLDDQFYIYQGVNHSFDENGIVSDNFGMMLVDYINNTKQKLIMPDLLGVA